MVTPIEKQIVTLLRDSPKEAIPLIYNHYGSSLYGVVHGMLRDEATSKDVLQESFVKYWSNAASYDPAKARLFTWLMRIARNTALDKMRSTGRRSTKEIRIDSSDVYDVGEVGISPDLMDMRKQLSSLDIKYQEVLEALYFQGMTQQEASEALELPLGTIKSRLRIAIRELRVIFEVGKVLLVLLMTYWI